jgi:hypothetical protein
MWLKNEFLRSSRIEYTVNEQNTKSSQEYPFEVEIEITSISTT